MKQEKAMLLNGNHAASYGALLSRPGVIPIYPITPQTPIAEKLVEMQAEKELEAEIITPESEHSAMSASIAASLTGARVFTATASQGLMLMHEMLHYAAGARAPIVLVNVNRTVGSPWGFWPDQTDSLSQRDTGWIQFYCESPQESLDTIPQAYKTAETVLLPAMVIYEAFYVSHTMEIVKIPARSTVDGYLPAYEPENMLDPSIGKSWGNVVNQEMYSRHRKQMGEAMEKVFGVAEKAAREWEELTGRSYGLVQKYRCEDAEFIIVTMGSLSGTARVAVDHLRNKGIPAGLLKIKLFRPFPAEAVRKELEAKADVVVLDRNFSPGLGGILHQELKAALYGLNNAPRIHGYLAGVGGLNVSPGDMENLVKNAMHKKMSINSIWVG